SIVAIQVVHQEALELLLLTQNRWTEIDQCGRRTHLVDRLWTRFGNVLPAAADHIVHERVDHTTYRFIDHTPFREVRKLRLDQVEVTPEDLDRSQWLERQKPRAQPVVHIVIVVDDLIDEVRDLCLKRGTLLAQETLAHLAKLLCVLWRAMLENAFARLEAEVE